MIELLVSEILATLPFHVFAYIPFRSHLRVPWRWMPALLLLIEAADLLALVLLMEWGISFSYANLVAFPISVAFFFVMIRVERGKIAFVYIFTTAYLMMVRGAARYLTAAMSFSKTGMGVWQFGILTLVIFLLTLPFMLRYINKTAQMVFETEAIDVWRFIWLLPLFNCALVVLLTYTPNGKIGLLALLTRLLLLLSMFLIYYNILSGIRSFQKQMADEEHIRHLEQLSAVQASQYTALQERIEETRRARHDLRQHLMAIQDCIDHRDMDALIDYMAKYWASIPTVLDDGMRFCKNYAVNAALQFYAEKAAGNGIDMTVSVRMEEDPIIWEPELCVMLGNLLENALEACTGRKEDPFIRVNLVQHGVSMLTLTVDNTCPEPPVWEDGKLRSSKHEGFGLGTELVRTISEKYHGDARFAWEDGVFYASVILNP